MPDQQRNNPEERTRTAVLINSIENPDAQIDESTFQRKWHWIKLSRDWKPGDPLPHHRESIDAIIVFSSKHKEDGIRQLCERVRALPDMSSIPMLVAVNQYQMPLANRVREMPNTDYVVLPIEEEPLIANLNRAVATQP